MTAATPRDNLWFPNLVEQCGLALLAVPIHAVHIHSLGPDLLQQPHCAAILKFIIHCSILTKPARCDGICCIFWLSLTERGAHCQD